MQSISVSCAVGGKGALRHWPMTSWHTVDIGQLCCRGKRSSASLTNDQLTYSRYRPAVLSRKKWTLYHWPTTSTSRCRSTVLSGISNAYFSTCLGCSLRKKVGLCLEDLWRHSWDKTWLLLIMNSKKDHSIQLCRQIVLTCLNHLPEREGKTILVEITFYRWIGTSQTKLAKQKNFGDCQYPALIVYWFQHLACSGKCQRQSTKYASSLMLKQLIHSMKLFVRIMTIVLPLPFQPAHMEHMMGVVIKLKGTNNQKIMFQI